MQTDLSTVTVIYNEMIYLFNKYLFSIFYTLR